MHLSLEGKAKPAPAWDKLSIFISLFILSAAIYEVSAELDLVCCFFFFICPWLSWWPVEEDRYFSWKLTNEQRNEWTNEYMGDTKISIPWPCCRGIQGANPESSVTQSTTYLSRVRSVPRLWAPYLLYSTNPTLGQKSSLLPGLEWNSDSWVWTYVVVKINNSTNTSAF